MCEVVRGHSASQWVLVERWAYSKPCQWSKIECFGKFILAFNHFRKTLRLKSLRGFSYVGSFKYVRVLNIPGFSICQGSVFPALDRDYLFSLIWQGSEYASWRSDGSVLNIPGLWIWQVSAYLSVDRYSYDRVVNMPGQIFTGF